MKRKPTNKSVADEFRIELLFDCSLEHVAGVASQSRASIPLHSGLMQLPTPKDVAIYHVEPVAPAVAVSTEQAANAPATSQKGGKGGGAPANT